MNLMRRQILGFICYTDLVSIDNSTSLFPKELFKAAMTKTSLLSGRESPRRDTASIGSASASTKNIAEKRFAIDVGLSKSRLVSSKRKMSDSGQRRYREPS